VRFPKTEWFPNGRIYVIDEVVRLGIINVQNHRGSMAPHFGLPSQEYCHAAETFW
jgi:hypothetical protein